MRADRLLERGGLSIVTVTPSCLLGALAPNDSCLNDSWFVATWLAATSFTAGCRPPTATDRSARRPEITPTRRGRLSFLRNLRYPPLQGSVAASISEWQSCMFAMSYFRWGAGSRPHAPGSRRRAGVEPAAGTAGRAAMSGRSRAIFDLARALNRRGSVNGLHFADFRPSGANPSLRPPSPARVTRETHLSLVKAELLLASVSDSSDISSRGLAAMAGRFDGGGSGKPGRMPRTGGASRGRPPARFLADLQAAGSGKAVAGMDRGVSRTGHGRSEE